MGKRKDTSAINIGSITIKSDKIKLDIYFGEKVSGETVFVTLNDFKDMSNIFIDTDIYRIGFHNLGKVSTPMICLKQGYIDELRLPQNVRVAILKVFHVMSFKSFTDIVYAVCYANKIPFWSDMEDIISPYDNMFNEDEDEKRDC